MDLNIDKVHFLQHEMTEEEQNFESGKKGRELAISLQEPTDNIGLENFALTQDNMVMYCTSGYHLHTPSIKIQQHYAQCDGN